MVLCDLPYGVALFTRAWIEILNDFLRHVILVVALFTRAWIEMQKR